MNKKYAIFDMDGTLIDSMSYWNRLAEDYLSAKGISPMPAEIPEIIKPMTMTESAAYFIKRFGFVGTPDSIAAEMNAVMDEHYRKDIELKSGVRKYLEQLKSKGVTMCVASATAAPLMTACLSRLNVIDDFAFVLSCEEVGTGKDSPDVYLEAMERLSDISKSQDKTQLESSDIAVYEDALFAAKTAKKAGFYVIGVFDENNKAKWERLKNVSDELIEDFLYAKV